MIAELTGPRADNLRFIAKIDDIEETWNFPRCIVARRRGGRFLVLAADVTRGMVKVLMAPLRPRDTGMLMRELEEGRDPTVERVAGMSIVSDADFVVRAVEYGGSFR